MEYHSAIKNTEVVLFAITWVDLEDIMLSEISYRDRQILNNLAYMWNLKKKAHKNRHQICGCQRWGCEGEGMG